MTREEFKKEIDTKGYKWREEGECIIVEGPGYVYLNSLKSIPDNVQFNNVGGVHLNSLRSIPDNVEFRNRDYVDLNSLKSIGNNVQFNNSGWIDIRSMEAIPINLDAEEIFQNEDDIIINDKWLNLEKNIPFRNSRWKSVDGRVKMYESWAKNNY